MSTQRVHAIFGLFKANLTVWLMSVLLFFYIAVGCLALTMPRCAFTNVEEITDQMFLLQSCLYNVTSAGQCIAVCAVCLCG